MLEAIKDNTTPRGIYSATFGLNSKPCWWVSDKRAKEILSYFETGNIYISSYLNSIII